MKSEILAKVIRGETVESVHRGHLLIVDGLGNEIFNVGDAETVCFIRSSAKPFQAIPFLTSGAAERFGFLDKEIALACASHSGEEMHTTLAAKMLEKIGLSEADLRCGAHFPFSEKRAAEMMRNGETPTQLHNNCSGKHAAMLAFAKHTNAELATYEKIENPIQQAILETVSLFTETPKDEIPLAIDGCCAPNFALSVRAMAKSFLKLVFPPKNFDEELREACRRIISAMLLHPELVGGTERLDTMLMEANRGKFISKIGAEGVWLCGVLPCEKYPKGLGISMKIEDGDDKRARAVISVEVLRQLGIFEAETLAEISPLPILNRRGETVGQVEANFRLLENSEL
ncbi:MAG TPA: asparaginase [Pyrinomonadaceae bacterium]|nr:asparaginase [Pyrinomonadaceae bacterium]